MNEELTPEYAINYLINESMKVKKNGVEIHMLLSVLRRLFGII